MLNVAARWFAPEKLADLIGYPLIERNRAARSTIRSQAAMWSGSAGRSPMASMTHSGGSYMMAEMRSR